MSQTETLAARVACGVEYDGRQFAGFQLQQRQRTVQGELESALSHVANEPVRVIGSGRTDSGVHAAGQVVHFESTAARDTHAWLLGANTQLSEDVALTWVCAVAPDFHARFSADARTYRYRIVNRLARPVIERNNCTWVRDRLDAAIMHRAAQALVGEHDFSSFRAAACQANHPVRRIRSLDVMRHGDRVDTVIVGNAFLHHMVRNIMGALIDIGTGRRPAEWLPELLRARDRRQAAVTAFARGLTLERVTYGPRWRLPAAATSGGAR